MFFRHVLNIHQRTGDFPLSLVHGLLGTSAVSEAVCLTDAPTLAANGPHCQSNYTHTHTVFTHFKLAVVKGLIHVPMVFPPPTQSLSVQSVAHFGSPVGVPVVVISHSRTLRPTADHSVAAGVDRTARSHPAGLQ
jgi:hypothetical protein